MTNPRLLRIVTVPMSLNLLLGGQFRFFIRQGFEVTTASAAGEGIDPVVVEGAAHVVIPFTRKITPLQDLWCLWLTIRLIRRVKPHIVHTHTPKAGLIGMLAAWFCAVPVRLHTVAGLPVMEAQGLKRWVLLLTERLTIGCANAIFPNGTGLLRFLSEHFATARGKFRVLGKGSSNGIDCRHFARSPHLLGEAAALRESYEVKPGETVFCFVGRMVKDKGVVELVDAFVNLDLPAHLFLVGPSENDLDPLPEQTLRQMADHPRIRTLGFHRDVRPWICAGDIFVLPSYREGFPNVVLQACALGVPCVVTNITGSNEIVEDGVTGLVVPARDARSLEKAMRELAMNPALRKQMASAAGNFVRANFEQHVFWDYLHAEYKEQLARHVPEFR